MSVNSKNCPGITIIEIVIGLALLGLVSLFVYSIFATQIRLFVGQIIGIGVSSQNKIALEDITTQTRQAESIVITCPTCQADETTDTNSVVYKLWGLDSGGNPTSSYFDYVAIKQVGTDLKRIVYKDPSSSRTASEDIIATHLAPAPDGLTFVYNNQTVVS